MTPTKLRFEDHVRACVIGDQMVLLDLKRTRYFGLSGRHCQAIVAATGMDGSNVASPPDNEDTSGLDTLLRQRLLTSARLNSDCQKHPLPAATRTLSLEDDPHDADIRVRDLCRFMVATATAALWLRCRSLEAIADKIAAIQGRRRSPDTMDREAHLRRAVGTFNHLRPLVFTSRDKCLFDSIALLLFLARQDIATRLVIGVSVQPFRAHAWVQDRSEVLNDLHENVLRFTPILIA